MYTQAVALRTGCRALPLVAITCGSVMFTWSSSKPTIASSRPSISRPNESRGILLVQAVFQVALVAAVCAVTAWRC